MTWPYSDEYTAGIETQLPGAVRMGTMFFYRTNRKQIGQVNTLQPATEYTKYTITIPNGPGGTVANPKPTTADVYNISVAANSLAANVRDNVDYLDTDYKASSSPPPSASRRSGRCRPASRSARTAAASRAART